jgi:hypothetical protein
LLRARAVSTVLQQIAGNLDRTTQSRGKPSTP